jgi:hypothetical protein
MLPIQPLMLLTQPLMLLLKQQTLLQQLTLLLKKLLMLLKTQLKKKLRKKQHTKLLFNQEIKSPALLSGAFAL